MTMETGADLFVWGGDWGEINPVLDSAKKCPTTDRCHHYTGLLTVHAHQQVT